MLASPASALFSGKHPLPLPTVGLSRALTRLKRRLQEGQADPGPTGNLEAAPLATQAALGHVEALLAFLETDWQAKSIRPSRVRPAYGALAREDVTCDVLSALRTSGQWMTCRELAAALAAKHRLALLEPDQGHLIRKIRRTVRTLHAQGAVELQSGVAQDGQRPQRRWRLSRTMFPLR